MQFAKAPEPGRVKTRLVPAVSESAAAVIARTLTRHVAQCLEAAREDWDVFLCADDPSDPVLRDIAASFGSPIVPQGDGDLGTRMLRAAGRALSGYRAVVIVGSDCPGYDPAYLRAARDGLRSDADAVIGPAVDGGYVLIGFTRVTPGIFADIDWGGGTVLDAQRRNLRRLGMNWVEMPARRDVDRPEDLALLAEFDLADGRSLRRS